MFLGASTGIMYLQYIKQNKKEEKTQKKILKGLEQKMIEENIDFRVWVPKDH